jgi:hypothetical protein
LYGSMMASLTTTIDARKLSCGAMSLVALNGL